MRVARSGRLGVPRCGSWPGVRVDTAPCARWPNDSGVCTATVYALVERGELDHVRVPNCIRIAESSLARLIAGAGKQC